MNKTVDRARLEFERTGTSIAEWAREHGFTRSLVYAVLRGERRALRGQTHDIAVRLGIKKGVLRGEGRSQRQSMRA